VCSVLDSCLLTDLGPEFVHEALKADPVARPLADGRALRFLANVDPVDMLRSIGVGSQDALKAENTLVVIVSKTFTTAGIYTAR
jgi:glucose-6-phosphate isomerase